MLLCKWSGTVRLCEQVLFFERDIYLCKRSGTVRLWEPVFCLNKYSLVNGPGPFVWLREPGEVLSEIFFPLCNGLGLFGSGSRCRF